MTLSLQDKLSLNRRARKHGLPTLWPEAEKEWWLDVLNARFASAAKKALRAIGAQQDEAMRRLALNALSSPAGPHHGLDPGQRPSWMRTLLGFDLW